MQQNLHTWKFLSKALGSSKPVVMLYVLESKGSSPGRQGFVMGINAEGELSGSIGGGIMEHKFVEMAKATLHQQHSFKSLHKQLHDKLAPINRSGMICSGEQTIFLHSLTPGDKPMLDKIIDELEANRCCAIELNKDGIQIMNDENYKPGLLITEDENWVYRNRIGLKDHLYIVGGGHCSLAFSKLMKDLDFLIHVFDERSGLNTFDSNMYAHEKMILDQYQQLQELIPSGENNYVVIMTFGYRTDAIALRALAGKEFAYIGCLGSKKKMENLFEEFAEEGMEEDWIKNIHAPIGLPIKSQTPEEIAISIAAEIILIRNKGK